MHEVTHQLGQQILFLQLDPVVLVSQNHQLDQSDLQDLFHQMVLMDQVDQYLLKDQVDLKGLMAR